MRISDWSSDVALPISSETQAAQDAHVRIDGYDVYSATNTVSDAIDGVSLNLLATDPGVSKSLTVAFNNTAAATAIQAFVSAYNSAVTTMRSEEHTSELQSLMRISYAVFCLKKQKHTKQTIKTSIKSQIHHLTAYNSHYLIITLPT